MPQAQCYTGRSFFLAKGGGVNFNIISLILYFHFVIKFRLLLLICGLHFWCPLNLKMLPTPLTAIWSYKIDTVSITSDLMWNNELTCNKCNELVMIHVIQVYCNLVIQNKLSITSDLMRNYKFTCNKSNKLV